MSSFLGTRDPSTSLNMRKLAGADSNTAQTSQTGQQALSSNVAGTNPQSTTLPAANTSAARITDPSGAIHQTIPTAGPAMTANATTAVQTAAASLPTENRGLAGHAGGATPAAGGDTSGGNNAAGAATDQAAGNLLDPTGYYDQAQKSIDKQEVQARRSGADQIAANQRRAATLSALSGRGLGGGFAQALSQGTISGQNAMQNEVNQMEGQRQAIYGQEASEAFSAQQQNKQNAFQLGMTTASNTAEANAQKLTADKQTALGALNDLHAGFDMDPTGKTRAAGSTVQGLVAAVNGAQTAAELTTAKANLDKFKQMLASLKAQYPKASGKDWQNIVNSAEKNGYFAGTATLPAQGPTPSTYGITPATNPFNFK